MTQTITNTNTIATTHSLNPTYTSILSHLILTLPSTNPLLRVLGSLAQTSFLSTVPLTLTLHASPHHNYISPSPFNSPRADHQGESQQGAVQPAGAVRVPPGDDGSTGDDPLDTPRQYTLFTVSVQFIHPVNTIYPVNTIFKPLTQSWLSLLRCCRQSWSSLRSLSHPPLTLLSLPMSPISHPISPLVSRLTGFVGDHGAS